ncbi:MAG: methylated-DNA--[protein]-cysteine S-methyltransferase [Armatimonadetes bacterium]|nr:methylated-DNA--[protein]-cysteine S-methyltransferase [Armatimonadota bacterium]
MKTFCAVETKLGFVALISRNGKLTHSTLFKPSRDEAIAALNGGLDDTCVEYNAGFGDLPKLLKEYAEGVRVDFSKVPLDVTAFGPFHAKALLAAQHIPYGEMVTYGELAKMAGSDGAARAAGSAMANNTMPIIVPCHRVVASGGRIGGFAAGLEWKRTLLRLEGVDI